MPANVAVIYMSSVCIMEIAIPAENREIWLATIFNNKFI